MTGYASVDTEAVAVRFRDLGQGYWVVPVGTPDPQNSGELAWSMTTSFGDIVPDCMIFFSPLSTTQETRARGFHCKCAWPAHSPTIRTAATRKIKPPSGALAGIGSPTPTSTYASLLPTARWSAGRHSRQWSPPMGAFQSRRSRQAIPGSSIVTPTAGAASAERGAKTSPGRVPPWRGNTNLRQSVRRLRARLGPLQCARVYRERPARWDAPVGS